MRISMLAVACAAVVASVQAWGGPEEAVGEAREVIRSLGLEWDEEAAGTAAAEAVLRSADPGVRIWSGEEWSAREAGGEGDEGGAVAETLPTGIGYVKIHRMDSAAADAVEEALRGWAKDGAAGAVLDVRGAGGTDEEAVWRVARLYTPGNGSWWWKSTGADGERTRTAEAGWAAAVGYPTMVLTDGGTTGAAELLAAVFGGSVKGGMTVGTRTAGDPLVRTAVELSGGRVATMRSRTVATGDGRTYDGREGVEPDVALSEAALAEVPEEASEPAVSFRRTKKGVLDEEKEDKALRERVKEDAALRRAVDVIQGLEALGYGG